MNAKKFFTLTAAGLLLSFSWSVTASATEEAVRQDQAVQQQSETAAQTTPIQKHLMKKFDVDRATLSELQARDLDYGEINHALSIIQKMPEGITEKNIERVTTLYQEENMSWEEISQKELGVPVGEAVRQNSSQATTPAPDISQAESINQKEAGHAPSS